MLFTLSTENTFLLFLTSSYSVSENSHSNCTYHAVYLEPLVSANKLATTTYIHTHTHTHTHTYTHTCMDIWVTHNMSVNCQSCDRVCRDIDRIQLPNLQGPDEISLTVSLLVWMLERTEELYSSLDGCNRIVFFYKTQAIWYKTNTYNITLQVQLLSCKAKAATVYC